MDNEEEDKLEVYEISAQQMLQLLKELGFTDEEIADYLKQTKGSH